MQLSVLYEGYEIAKNACCSRVRRSASAEQTVLERVSAKCLPSRRPAAGVSPRHICSFSVLSGATGKRMSCEIRIHSGRLT
jgi:hypothetical protein